MAVTGRSLREVLGDDEGRRRLAEDPAAALREAGFADLPEPLVAESVVSYADTAPVELAEHLAPFVTAHRAIGPADPAVPSVDAAFDLLASAPAVAPDAPAARDPLDGLDGPDALDGLELGAAMPDPAAAGPAAPESGALPGAGFGAGQDPAGGAETGFAYLDGAPLDLAFGQGGGWSPPDPALGRPTDPPVEHVEAVEAVDASPPYQAGWPEVATDRGTGEAAAGDSDLAEG